MSNPEAKLLKAIFGPDYLEKMDRAGFNCETLPSSGLDRLPVSEQRRLLLSWQDKVVDRIKEKVADVYENGNGQRVRHLISALSSVNGKIS